MAKRRSLLTFVLCVFTCTACYAVKVETTPDTEVIKKQLKQANDLDVPLGDLIKEVERLCPASGEMDEIEKIMWDKGIREVSARDRLREKARDGKDYSAEYDAAHGGGSSDNQGDQKVANARNETSARGGGFQAQSQAAGFASYDAAATAISRRGDAVRKKKRADKEMGQLWRMEMLKSICLYRQGKKREALRMGASGSGYGSVGEFYLIGTLENMKQFKAEPENIGLAAGLGSCFHWVDELSPAQNKRLFRAHMNAYDKAAAKTDYVPSCVNVEYGCYSGNCKCLDSDDDRRKLYHEKHAQCLYGLSQGHPDLFPQEVERRLIEAGWKSRIPWIDCSYNPPTYCNEIRAMLDAHPEAGDEIKAKREAGRQALLAAQLKVEKEAKSKAEQEAKLKAEQEAKLKAGRDAETPENRRKRAKEALGYFGETPDTIIPGVGVNGFAVGISKTEDIFSAYRYGCRNLGDVACENSNSSVYGSPAEKCDWIACSDMNAPSFIANKEGIITGIKIRGNCPNLKTSGDNPIGIGSRERHLRKRFKDCEGKDKGPYKEYKCYNITFNVSGDKITEIAIP